MNLPPVEFDPDEFAFDLKNSELAMPLATLTWDESIQFLEEAAYLDQVAETSDKTIHFGKDKLGQDFVLVLDAISSKGHLGFLHL